MRNVYLRSLLAPRFHSFSARVRALAHLFALNIMHIEQAAERAHRAIVCTCAGGRWRAHATENLLAKTKTRRQELLLLLLCFRFYSPFAFISNVIRLI